MTDAAARSNGMSDARAPATNGHYDVYKPASRPIDPAFVAAKLARIIRFNGEPGAISQAQHAVLGAEAIVAEASSGNTAALLTAALYLHHDDHKAFLGDRITPVETQIGLMVPDYGGALDLLRANWQAAIYQSLGLPPPDAWLQKDVAAVAMMNLRMRAAESRGLFGPQSVAHLAPEARRTPRFNASLCPPWPPERAAEAYKTMHRKLTGRIIR
jgi:hypothetical protein